MIKLIQQGGKKHSFTLPTYREVVVVKNGEVECRFESTRDALISRGFEVVVAPVEEPTVETPEETPVEEPKEEPKPEKKSKKKSSGK